MDQLPVCPASAKDGSAAVLLCARPSRGEAEKFADAIVEAHKKSLLQNMPKSHRQGKSARCALRSTRDRETICVVEDPETSWHSSGQGDYNGLYHVLHRVISPMDGVGPDGIRIKELLARLNNDEVKEVIMAAKSTVEGEATAMYISKLLKPLGIKISRLAYGIPVGGDLQYADRGHPVESLKGQKSDLKEKNCGKQIHKTHCKQ